MGEPEERAPTGDEVERSDLAGDLDGMQRVRIERGGADPDTLGRPGYEDERDDRRLEQQVVEDRHDVHAGRLSPPPQLGVVLGSLVGLEPEPELETAQVRSSVRSVRSRIRSMRMMTR